MFETSKETPKELDYDGRVAIVTGAGSGMGRSYALELAARGAMLIINDVGWVGAKRERAGQPNPGLSVVEEIRATGGQCIHDSGDVSVRNDAQKTVALAIEEYGRIDILVNNAGVSEKRTLIQDEPGPYFDSVMDVHVKGPLNMVSAAWPHMTSQHYGRILNTGSASAVGVNHPTAGYYGSYAIAKAAVFGITHQQAGAGKHLNINVNMVMPWAYTPMTAASIGGTDRDAFMKEHLSPSQVVRAMLWFLHESCSITNQIISAAGGRVTRVLFAQPPGYVNPELLPEDVRDNWELIRGNEDGNGFLHNVAELVDVTQEEQAIRAAVNAWHQESTASDRVS